MRTERGAVRLAEGFGSPVAVEYSVTPMGRTLQQPLAALHAWALDHAAQIEHAQADFDRRASG